jgi:hypothetical protein
MEDVLTGRYAIALGKPAPEVIEQNAPNDEIETSYELGHSFDFSKGVSLSPDEEKDLINKAITGLIQHKDLNSYSIATGNFRVTAEWGMTFEDGKRDITIIITHNYQVCSTEKRFSHIKREG